MPDLIQSLKGHDLNHLQIVAEHWGVELRARDAHRGLSRLALLLLERDQVEEIVDLLPEAARAALGDLVANAGRLPWQLFTRRYGEVREMGPARRDRERPDRNPASPAEELWYRALLARSFFDTPNGPQEFAYIPDDLLNLLPDTSHPEEGPLGRPASPAERAFTIPVNDHILEHACTLLAALRLELPADELEGLAAAWSSGPQPLNLSALQSILSASGLLDEQGGVQPEPARLFLEAPRGEALLQLFSAWLHSPDINELRLLPGLGVEGEWRNDPLQARQAILGFLPGLPKDTWFSLPAFVEAIRQAHPDFQRPAGDYDSWYLRDARSGEFLRGFAHWEAVDGALIRFLICGPLHWFGVLDLAAPAAGEPVTAFRFSDWAKNLLQNLPVESLPPEEELLRIRSDGSLLVPRGAPRVARYQIARFCVWEKESEDGYRYALTPASLERARQQGLRLSHLMALLHRYAAAVPPSLLQALERWETSGSQARIERVTLLRVSSPEILQALRLSRAARFLGDPVGPTSVIVNPGAWRKVLAALAEMGYLGEWGSEKE